MPVPDENELFSAEVQEMGTCLEFRQVPGGLRIWTELPSSSQDQRRGTEIG